MKKLDKNQIVDFKHNHIDDVGKIYKYHNSYIRIINRNRIKFVQKLFSSGCIQKLIEEKLLVPTEISDYYIEDEKQELILVHKGVWNPISAANWSFDMLRDAAFSIIKMNRILNKYGYELKDCHVNNIVFDGINPIYVDFGSITKFENRWKKTVINEFERDYLYPLLMKSKNMEETVWALYQNYRITAEQVKKMYYGASILSEAIIKVIDCLRKLFLSRIDSYAFYERKLKEISYQSNAFWTDYQDQYWNKGSKRLSRIIEIIKDNTRDIRTAVELGANQGFFSYLLAESNLVERILATDYDWNAVNKMYLQFKSKKINTIIPAVVDVLSLENDDMKKYLSDLVVANALTHHLLLTQGVGITRLVDIFAKLSNKYLLVEFMPLGLWSADAGRKKVPSWYTLEWFIENLSKEFDVVICEKLEKNRIAILAKKRNQNETY